MNIKKFTVNPFQENTYVVWNDNKNCLIIDAGCYYPEEDEALQNFLETKELNPIGLLNTHCHIDHVLGIKALYDRFQCPFYCHIEEQFNLDRIEAQGMMFGIKVPPLPEAAFISDGDLKLGDFEFECLFVPGHSPGHLAFYEPHSNLLLGGDIIFDGSIGRTDLPGCNHDQLISGIREKVYALPDSCVVYAGHMGETTIGKEKKTNPFVTA